MSCATKRAFASHKKVASSCLLHWTAILQIMERIDDTRMFFFFMRVTDLKTESWPTTPD